MTDPGTSLNPKGASRRQFLRHMGVSAVAIGAVAASASINSLQADSPLAWQKQVMQAASTLCGVPVQPNYIQMSYQFWDAFLATPGVTYQQALDLIKLVNSTPMSDMKKALDIAGLTDVSRRFMLLWYTGYIDRYENGTVEHLQVVTYDNALVWYAVPFTKPPMTCGPYFGYWKCAPETPFAQCPNEANKIIIRDY